MERTSFFKLSSCWLRDFDSLAHFLLTMENAGGSAVCIHRELLPQDAIVIHVVTRSGRHCLVLVNVHFEPDLTIRQLRGRLRLSHHMACISPWCVSFFLGRS